MISLKYPACVMLILHVNILTLPIILIDLLNQFREFHFFLLLIILDNSMLACETILLCINVFFYLCINDCSINMPIKIFLSMFTRLWWNTFSTGNYRLRPLDLSARLPRDFHLLS